ncbi:MAG TPA: type 4a pilus biogenesis protein PilO [Mariprofundaceae bacterium]|nr:type 4a pilus biogenesis protein PilO [Mariprofundaceae bacterium]
MDLDSLKSNLFEALRPLLPLPLWQKAAALALGFLLIGGIYFYLGWMPAREEIARQESQVKQQRMLLERHQRMARDLPRKKREFAELQKQLRVALHMLPKQSQIPDLLENVSWAGKDSGLEFSTFKPQKETQKHFYAEVPVDLSVSGTYKQLLTFLRRVGEMPRIVDVKNLSLSQGKKSGQLMVKGQAVTYRFIDKPAKKNASRQNSGGH